MSIDHDNDPFLYTPLASSGEIRLLTLLPPKGGDDNIECTLSTALLDDNPVYDALSYVWGDKIAIDLILVNMQQFQTTKNLRKALTLIRHVEPITIWVDAICINQRDLDERRDQVLQMRRIYASAQQTRIMLGDDDHEAENVQLCIPFLAGLAECHRVLEKWKAEGRECAVEKMLSEMWERLPPSGEVWRFTWVMFSSEWFTRVWTIQEIAVASKAFIIYGRNVLEWSRLEEAIKMVQLATEYIELHRRENWFRQENGKLAFRIPGTGTILSDDQMWNFGLLYRAMPTSLVALRRQVKENNPASLISTLKHAWYHKATDPKDKVYALLGIIPEDERLRYQVDYSISVEQAYSATMKTMLQHDSKMMVLSLAGTDQRSTADLPSWCPDWRPLEKGSFDNKELLDREWLFTAAKENSRQWSAGGTDKELLVYPQQDWRILRIKGTMIGVIGPDRWIRSVGDHLKEIEAGIANESMEAQESSSERLSLPVPNMNFEDFVDVVSLGTWACLLDNGNGNTLMGPKENMQKWSESDPGHPDPLHGWKYSMNSLSEMMRQYEDKQTFMAGGGGRVFAGLGPASTQAGDAVCLLHGAQTPVLMRKAEGEDPVIVGACYIRGIMEGQLMKPDSGLSSGWYRIR